MAGEAVGGRGGEKGGGVPDERQAAGAVGGPGHRHGGLRGAVGGGPGQGRLQPRPAGFGAGGGGGGGERLEQKRGARGGGRGGRSGRSSWTTASNGASTFA